MFNFRIGQGYDVHRLVVDRKLILGGVVIPFEKGLYGHSDADVLIHAIIDAILGALALGDIGKIFPDNDIKYKNINSGDLLQDVYQRFLHNKWQINNIDCTIVAQKPKLANYIDLMRQNVAQNLNIKITDISIKAKTNENLGYLGGSEAIEAQSVILLYQI